ncbi:MAG: cytochrome b/b6 domain-containing protein [Rhizobiaceae bacterium]|nr:cytochrome b/b6 domain-containing protein [Rhizobiaceae bacterium]
MSQTANAPMETRAAPAGRLVYRQSVWTRVTHWIWAVALFFLLLSGLQIFNAHPALYVGDQSGFAFDNAVLRLGATREGETLKGVTTVLGTSFETTGVLGASGPDGQLQARGFPAWATIPSGRDLATGRVVHFFFAWVLAGTLLVWLAASLVNGHFRRDIVPKGTDLKALPGDVADHARLRFRHGRSYNPLQKLSYAAVLIVLLPLMILTGLAMSPGFNATAPWLPELFGGRQTARTVHFMVMVLLVAFFLVHIAMVVLAGPFNELRSMITGWVRVDDTDGEKRP